MSSGNNLKKPNNIFDLERNVFNNLNNFNQVYASHLRCSKTGGNANNELIDQSTCPSNVPTNNDVKNAYTKLSASITTLQNAIATMKANGGASPADYDASYNQILATYANVLETRDNLDEKIAELYNTNDSALNFYDRMYISTIYSKILLTILATSLAYYVFMQMRKRM